jgi:hypothetical protein
VTAVPERPKTLHAVCWAVRQLPQDDVPALCGSFVPTVPPTGDALVCPVCVDLASGHLAGCPACNTHREDQL